MPCRPLTSLRADSGRLHSNGARRYFSLCSMQLVPLGDLRTCGQRPPVAHRDYVRAFDQADHAVIDPPIGAWGIGRYTVISGVGLAAADAALPRLEPLEECFVPVPEGIDLGTDWASARMIVTPS